MSERTPAQDSRQHRQLLQDAGIAMLMTIDERGAHAGRPMLPLWLGNDPHTYFLTHQNSHKVAQIAKRRHVALTLSNARCYFVALGSACEAVETPMRIIERWRTDPSGAGGFPFRAWDGRLLASVTRQLTVVVAN